MAEYATPTETPFIRPYFARTLRRARTTAGLSLRELARRAGTSHATLLAYENATKVPTVATFLRVLESSGYAVDIQLSPRIRERDGLDRGEELRQVLELAEQFPARLSRTLTCPKFARQ
jgi:transcriptional regulator with XRE-family HTH domain